MTADRVRPSLLDAEYFSTLNAAGYYWASIRPGMSAAAMAFRMGVGTSAAERSMLLNRIAELCERNVATFRDFAGRAGKIGALADRGIGTHPPPSSNQAD